MKKVFVLGCAFLLSMFTASNAQTKAKCMAEVTDSPILRGFKLGMSSSDARATVKNHLDLKPVKRKLLVEFVDGKFMYQWEFYAAKKDLLLAFPTPEQMKKAERMVEVGETELAYTDATASPDLKLQFQGVSELKLRFFRDKLIDVDITYDRTGTKWSSIDEFTNTLSERLNLTKEFWDPTGRLFSTYRCTGFTVLARIGLYDSVGSLQLTHHRSNDEASDMALAILNAEGAKKLRDEEEKKRLFKP